MPVNSTRACILPLLILLLSACASTPDPKLRGHSTQVTGLGEDYSDASASLKAAANDVLFQAIGLVGTPYRYGGNSPEAGFDCSVQ